MRETADRGATRSPAIIASLSERLIARAVPPIFRKIQRAGNVDEGEMFRTLNMGIGMALAVSAGDADRTVSLFSKRGHKAWIIGEVVRGRREVVLL